MNTTNNTILITGGSAGIGFEIAKLFSQKGNHVIITGRNAEKLEKAAAQLQHVTAIVSDVNNEADVNILAERLNKDFPQLNILINNAGNVSVYSLLDNEANAAEKAREEMQTNYFSVINLTEKLLPLLHKQKEAAIVNVTSITALVPALSIPTYSASKAALRSYSQALRLSLSKNSAIKVFELLPPLVNTDFSKEIGGEKGIDPSVVASDLFNAIQNEEYEVQVGGTASIYKLFLNSPSQALLALNSVE